MPYDGPTLKEFSGYFEAKEPGTRERADAWATAIGLQDVDHLKVSSFLVKTAIRHIKGEITQAQVHEIIESYYARREQYGRGDRYNGYEYYDPDTGERIESLDVFEANRLIDQAIYGGKKRTVRKSGRKTVDKLIGLLAANPRIDFDAMASTLQVSRRTIQKHIASLKKSGRLRRVGPDKGGHWEVV